MTNAKTIYTIYDLYFVFIKYNIGYFEGIVPKNTGIYRSTYIV